MDEKTLVALVDPTDTHIIPSHPKQSSHTEIDHPKPYSRKRKQKVILEEEEYVAALETIIERDFFPDSSKMKSHLELLNAYEGKNPSVVREVQRKILSEQRKFGATPTPVAHDVSADSSAGASSDGADTSTKPSSSNIDKSVTVDKFFTMYNSEDNDSFEKLHEKDLEEHRRKYHWAYETSEPGRAAGMLMWYHNDGRVLSGEERKKIDDMLALPSTFDERPNGVDTWRFRVRNQLLFPPELETSRDICMLPSDDAAARARILSGSATAPGPVRITDEDKKLLTDGSQVSNTTGTVMTANESSVTVVSTNRPQESEPQSARSLSMPAPVGPGVSERNKYVRDGIKGPKEIVHRNTRLRGSFLQDREKNGRPLRTPGSSPLEAPHTPSAYSDSSSGGGGEYRAVRMTPSPMPGTGAASPLITWGDICGTPQAIETNAYRGGEESDREKALLDEIRGTVDTSACADSFKMQDTPVREQLAQSLDSRNKAKQHRKKAKTEVHIPCSKTPLTPAGLALAQKIAGVNTSTRGGMGQTTSGRSSSGSSSSLRQSLTTATPTCRKPQIRTPSVPMRHNDQRIVSRTDSHPERSQKHAKLTDDLLKI